MQPEIRIGEHTLHLRTPSIIARMAWWNAYYALREADPGEEPHVIGAYAALGLAWDPAHGEAPWGALTGDIRARAEIVAEHTASWEGGALRVGAVGSEIATEFVTSLAPETEAAKTARRFSKPPSDAGTGGGTNSPDTTAETHSSGQG